jgi:hypothetical protein
MYAVLFVVIMVVGIAVVNVRRRGRERAVEARRDDRLERLAPVIGGTVSADGIARGTYRDTPVEVSLAQTFIDSPGSGHQSPIDIVRIHLLRVPGAHYWSCRARLRLLPVGDDEFQFSHADRGLAGGLMRRLGQLPEPDPGLEDRLRAAGLVDAIRALDRPTNAGWVPHVSFRPDFAALDSVRERAAAIGATDALEHDERLQSVLEVEVERRGDDDPSPDDLRALLDGALRIAQINAGANQ